MASNGQLLFSLFLQFFCTIMVSCTRSYTTSAAGAENASKFPAILVFGDSLVDTGNNNFVQTLARANHYPYGMSFPGGVATGRFSDGRLMGDLISEHLGIKQFVPPFLDPALPAEELKTGVCFASAGSGYDDYTTQFSGVVPVSAQVGVHLTSYVDKLKSAVGQDGAQNIISNALVFIVAGSNDYLINYNSQPNRRAQYPNPNDFRDFLHSRIKDTVKSLYDAGLRKIIVAGIPPFIDGTADYNDKLKSALPQVQASLPGSTIVYGDIATPMSDVTINPAKYGLVVSSPAIPCCPGMCIAATIPCPNPGQYFSFDGVHPTETVYRAMADSLVATALPQFSI